MRRETGDDLTKTAVNVTCVHMAWIGGDGW